MTYWLNGEFCEAPCAIDIADRGFLLGDGVFETILVVNGVPVFLDAHLARLQRSLKALFFDCRVDEELGAVITELTKRNGLADGLAAARVTVTRGCGARGLLFPEGADADPTMLVTVQSYTTSEAMPARLIVSRYRRSEKSVLANHKTLDYLDNVMARNQAAREGADDAVMLNSAGRVACASAANIFCIYEDGEIVTPPEEEGALPGIVRGFLLGEALKAGLSVIEGFVEVTDLQRASPLITNSLIGVRQAFIHGDENRPKTPQLEQTRILQTWYKNAVQAQLQKRADGH